MSERVLDYDPTTGMRTWFSTSDDEDTWHIRYEQDTATVMDANKEQQTDGFDRGADMWHAARIPLVIMMEWMTKHGIEAWNPSHKEGVRRLLNSSDYRYLRVNNFTM